MNKFVSSVKQLKGKTSTYYVCLVLEAFLASCGLSYVLGLVKDKILSASILTVFAFAGILVFLNWTHKKLKESLDEKALKRRMRWNIITSYIFSVLLILGYQLERYQMTEPGFGGKGKVLLMAVLLTCFLWPFVNIVYMLADKVKDGIVIKESKVNCKKIFLWSWLVTFLAFVPAFLAYYPIVMSYDFHAQVLMAERGYMWYSQHHPQIHTFQISVFYNLGKAIGSPQTGMAFMAIFHMLVMSVCMAYSVVVTSKLFKSKYTPFVATAIMALHPIHAVMTVSTTKDTMFTALFLLFVSTLFDRFVFADTRKKKILMDIAVLFSGILMSLYRMNASYAVVAAGIVLVIFAPKREKLAVIALTVLIFAGFKASYEAIRLGLNSQAGKEPIEMYSAIIQAYARVGYYHGNELDEDTRYAMSRCVPEESWGEYNPYISDPCKASAAYVYQYTWKPDLMRVYKEFFEIGLKYPNEYIDSFLETNRGYWFIDDTSYLDILGEGFEDRMGFLFTYNSSYTEGAVEEIKHESKLPFVEYLYECIMSANYFVNWPVLSLLFKTSFYCIVLVWLFFISIYMKNWKALGLLVLPEIYFCSLLLGPTVQVRYIFPLMVILPLFLALLLGKNTKNAAKEND